MKVFVITMEDSVISTTAAKLLRESSVKVGNNFEIETFDAILPHQVEEFLMAHMLEWNYPWYGKEYDHQTDLIKEAYTTIEPTKRIACFLSHWSLWKKCSDNKETFLILEHDALFTSKLPKDILNNDFGVVALNCPLGATRKAGVYRTFLKEGVHEVPTIDNLIIPQGLPGNSAYLLAPAMADKLLEATNKHGVWPNDALMCKQLFPGLLGVLHPGCTKVQKTRSTTSL